MKQVQIFYIGRLETDMWIHIPASLLNADFWLGFFVCLVLVCVLIVICEVLEN